MATGTSLEWVLRFVGRRTARVEVVGFEPQRRVRLSVVGGTLPLKPTITYRYEPADGGTRFTRRVEIEPTGAFRLMAPLMAPMIQKQNAAHVADPKRAIED